MLHHRSTPRGLYHFFESTSWSIALFSASSATNCFNRRFSSCNCFIWRAWCPNCIAGVKGERGCDEIELRKFRRTCITTWLRNRIDPRTVMEYAGHADLETTLRYARPAAATERIAAVSEIKWY